MDFELIEHLLEHALEDTLYLVPFLFVTYLFLEALEHKIGDRAETVIRKAGAAGPAIGALLGAVPQCGFSAAGAALYASRAITLGTLFAVLLSTSDEMLPLFIAAQVEPSVMFSILGCKIVIGMIMGFAIDGALRLRVRRRIQEHQHALNASASAEAAEHSPACEHEHDHDDHHSHGDDLNDHTFSHEHCHIRDCECSENSSWKDVVLCALKHTVQVSVIVYLISLALVAVLEIAGEEVISEFLAANPGIAIFASALVGLIPNCGASVVITQLYLDGMLGTGAMMSGLLVSAGVALLVLFGENRRVKQNLLILLGLFATGIIWGLAFELLGITFI